jgi:putative membrane protein
MDTLYLAAKTLHIIGFISWFAGLFYIVRLFVYHAEAAQRPEAERAILQPQLELMQSRLWKIITVPAMIGTLLGGLTMVGIKLHWAGTLGLWLHIKFGLLAMLLVYHHMCGAILKKQARGTSTWSGTRLRVFNEVATMLMAAIVSLAVFKTGMSALWGAAALVGLGVSLMLGIRFYRKVRQRAS